MLKIDRPRQALLHERCLWVQYVLSACMSMHRLAIHQIDEKSHTSTTLGLRKAIVRSRYCNIAAVFVACMFRIVIRYRWADPQSIRTLHLLRVKLREVIRHESNLLNVSARLRCVLTRSMRYRLTWGRTHVGSDVWFCRVTHIFHRHLRGQSIVLHC